MTVALSVCSVGGWASDFADSLVVGLAGAADLQPAREVAGPGEIASGTPRGTARSLARQSVPVEDRSVEYLDDEMFRNSKVVLPLLVLDLEPRVASSVRPMSGRSVGARPAAPWTRASGLPVPTPDSARDSRRELGSSWRSSGR